MKRNERVLFGLILAPVLLCGGFLIWFIRHNLGLNNFALASILLISLIITAFLNIRKIRNSFSDPMSRLTQQLDEPALSINPASFESNTPFHHLASSLQELLNHSEETHRDQLRNLSNENRKLQTHKQSQSNITLLDKQKNLDQARIIQMSQQILAEFIALNNLQRRENTDALRHDINLTSHQIVFLLQELQSPTHEQVSHDICHPAQACDEAIRLTWLLLQANGIDLIPVFDESCQKISTNKDNFKSLIFNFILKSVLQKKNKENESALNLNIKVLDLKRLHISLSYSSEAASFHLSQNENLSNSATIESTVTIPVESLKGNTLFIPGRKARVIADKQEQKQGIESRLLNLGFELIENNDEIDLCFICCKKNEDIIAASKTLNPTTLVLLTNNETYYKRDIWHQIAYPILQNELKAFVVEHFLKKKNIFDREMALQRANHQSDLMEEMLDILMSTLPNDRSKIHEARESKDIVALQKIIHRIEGGLLYTGATRLEYSIQCISKAIRQKNTFSEVEIIPLLIKLDHHIDELHSWYGSRQTLSDIS